MEYLILWAAFPFATHALAKEKKLNRFLWAFLGLLMGPFALVIVALKERGDVEGEDQDYS
jgi:hypothetical protein